MRRTWSVVVGLGVAFGGVVGCGRGGAATRAVEPTIEVGTDAQFRLAPGQSAQVAGSDLSVRFDGVSGDSRCPIGVMCVWAGDAAVHLRLVRGSGQPSAATLHVTTLPRAVTDGPATIELVMLDPVAHRDTPIKPSDYRVTLVIRGAT